MRVALFRLYWQSIHRKNVETHTFCLREFSVLELERRVVNRSKQPAAELGFQSILYENRQFGFWFYVWMDTLF